MYHNCTCTFVFGQYVFRIVRSPPTVSFVWNLNGELYKEESLQKELQELDFEICNEDYFDQNILEKYEAAKEELKRLHEMR